MPPLQQAPTTCQAILEGCLALPPLSQALEDYHQATATLAAPHIEGQPHVQAGAGQGLRLLHGTSEPEAEALALLALACVSRVIIEIGGLGDGTGRAISGERRRAARSCRGLWSGHRMQFHMDFQDTRGPLLTPDPEA